MRPADLNPLFAAASALRGIGPKTGALLDRLLGRKGQPARVIDLLLHLPHATIDRRARPKIRDAARDAVVVIEGRVTAHHPPGNTRGRAPYKVLIEDDTGDVTLVFFLNNFAWVEKALPIGTTRWVSGKLESWDGHLQMVHPDRVMDEEGLKALPAVEPIYGLTDGLYPRILTKAVEAAVGRMPDLPEWLEPNRAILLGWPSFADALLAVHYPTSPSVLDPQSQPMQRLAYDELLASQFALATVRGRMRDNNGRPTIGTGVASDRILAALPFRLTAGQEEALAEIRADMAGPKRMLRLLQGDVGSGKTIVALLAMATAIEAGHQTALMVPTEILARQHFERLTTLGAHAGITVALLTGRDKASERAKTLEGLANGAIALVIGTHALFQDSVVFQDLGLIVVDEQHRFGVAQRLALTEKGRSADMLLMTATPIPRTLVMTVFGDMDASAVREKPAGRQSIETRAAPIERLSEVVAAMQRSIEEGARVYWVCPLVTESEEVDLVAAEERFETLCQVFGDKVRLVHGQMKPAERDAAVADFASGEARILVATTVIEVGIDVPEASIMVIEHAERFGLAQLHQLRGRVGRGQARSSCLLLYKAPLGETPGARIMTMRETEDGFRIAEEDLRLRGEGELIGTRQSGLPSFRVANLDHHAKLLTEARQDAADLYATDPTLKTPRGEAMRRLLYLFERDAAVRLIEAG
ncbi:ATP-dependent DNA helicase RecG [Lichenihabitans psoromatis]|uniref:ATP-dependent DNA helicase RecG n=1 Tax=Lichenihabitans psoromatis TaxID=2528642 RepID=UPI0010384AF5|nr:ATP-dependent DNA helicase RecG [Lichenihabitans psoromatis]